MANPIAGTLVEVDDALEPGTRVEVRNNFDGRWSRGFEIAAVEGGGYRLLRLSDMTTLPITFEAETVRNERRRQGLWWY